jgi:hypothetical protein
MPHEDMMRDTSRIGRNPEEETQGESVNVTVPTDLLLALDDLVDGQGYDREYWIQAAIESFLEGEKQVSTAPTPTPTPTPPPAPATPMGGMAA